VFNGHVGLKRGLFVVCTAALVAGAPSSEGRVAGDVYTFQVTHGNGASTGAVISGDRRWARAIAFESEASDLVRGDGNKAQDVFVIPRVGKFSNLGRNAGAPWRGGRPRLVSRSIGGGSANGPSYAPAIGGGYDAKPTCVAFLSQASNIVRGDRNHVADAFVAPLSGGAPRRVSLPGGRESGRATTQVAVSGDCTKVAFVTGGRLYLAGTRGGAAQRVPSRGRAADPSFSVGSRNDLVFGDSRGVVLASDGTGPTHVVAPGGRNPAYNDVKNSVVAYEKMAGGHWQIAFRRNGGPEHFASARHGALGDGDSRDPVIGNSGFYISFESDAGNLGVNPNGDRRDGNGKPDVYLYTDTRKLTLLESVQDKSVPLQGGGSRPSMSFYANYIVFDSPAPIDALEGAHQIFMRYLGPA
jgi:hypothetical protein